MAWEIEVSDEFADWYNTLSDAECQSVHTGIDALERLVRPLADLSWIRLGDRGFPT